MKAFYNKHFLVGAATLLVLVTLIFQPLASALVTVRVVWEERGCKYPNPVVPHNALTQIPDRTAHSLQAIGLNQGTNFNDLTSFLTASGYASASVLYDLGDIPFVLDKYTVAPFRVKSSLSVSFIMLKISIGYR